MTTVKICGKEYPIKFTVNVIADLQERYGELTNWTKKMESLSETIWVLWRLINEGIAYERYFCGKNEPDLPDVRTFGMMLSFEDIQSPDIVNAIVNAYNEALGGQKKITTAELMEEAAKLKVQSQT